MDAIPKTKDPERYEARSFIKSGFVEIKPDIKFDVKMQYPLLGMQHAQKQCFVRQEVFELLQKAADKLPVGYRFRIYDAWRPFRLQHELYERYSKDIIRDYALEQCTDEQKKLVIQRFVSDPIEDRNVPPVHTTGGAVDLTILDENGQELDMGTGFDTFSDLTYMAAFESERNKAIRDNRRLLYHIMTDTGFTNLPSEWWHFDYGDRFWAYYKQQPAIYNGVFSREEIYEEA